MGTDLAVGPIDELREVHLLLALVNDPGPEVRDARETVDALMGELSSVADRASWDVIRGVRRATDSLTALAADRCGDRRLIDAARVAHRALDRLQRGV